MHISNHRLRAPTKWCRLQAPVAIGLLMLAVGVLLYLSDRQPSRTLLIPAVQGLAGLHLFGAMGLWLPSFVHTFSFSLFCAAALGLGPLPRYGACASWCLVNVAFECGQHAQLKAHWADALQGGWAASPWARPLAQYFLRGTFDLADVAAAVTGAMAAAAVLHFFANDRGD